MILTQQGCLNRQQRLRERMASLRVHVAFIADNRDIYYFTGLLQQQWPACLMLDAAGNSWLVAPSTEGKPCVQEYISYEPHTLYTNNPDNMRRLNAIVERKLSGSFKARRIGWQAEAMPHVLAITVARTTDPVGWTALDDTLADMQRRKDLDEIELIRRSIRADLAAYTAAQAAIAPGVNELEVLAVAQRAAMLDAGESVYHGGDYCSGEMGGSARDRRIEAGELYIVDAQTVYGGYWSDLSRAYSVGNQPTDLQQSIYAHIAAIQRNLVTLLKPGLRGTELWKILDRQIREHPALADFGLVHHAGHGVGLRAHEAPDLNRDREGILEPGNIISVEPGAYVAEARSGVRIENMYLITETGAENLSEYPMNLIPTHDPLAQPPT
ncbi:MAG: Xaa-Pro peptidase family protein [Chloroflexi bacterium]|nr:Xaa-Pro peptidase family protein [Chloroflexota bacterium]MCL5275174.1 Xaa-Pro peptidase family protein [Chloroflexota bacterium]